MSAFQFVNKYETVVVTKTDAGHDAQQRLFDKVTELMKKAGARHTRFEVWGKRRLAYTIQKCTKGLYTYYVYLAGGDFVKELNRMLRLSNIVLRYMTVRIGEGIDAETYDFDKEKQFDTFPSEAEEGHDHSRPMTGWEAEFQSRESAARDEDDDDDEEEDEEEEEEESPGREEEDEEDEDEK